MADLAVRVERETVLTTAAATAVLALVAEAAATDGVYPLSEHALLHLRHPEADDHVEHLLARAAGELVGYAHLEATDRVEGPTAELVVRPARRRSGVGRRLVEELLAAAAGGGLHLWAHGQHPAATALAETLRFDRVRELWQMRRSLLSPLPEPVLPPDVSVRTFVPGEDEEAWVAVNNRAFADHPEQGRWTVDDVRRREQEPWFDAEGFFLAERSGHIAGFHWTKVHGGGEGGHAHDPIGEVYVVGVDPSARGLGLGRALTLVGLHHLRREGLTQAMLYVDETNVAAIRVYESLGFIRWSVDVSYARTSSSEAEPEEASAVRAGGGAAGDGAV